MVKKLLLIFSLTLIVGNALADGPPKHIPMLFNYQGVLTDDGGNPLSDGILNLKFKISDSSGNILYEETQDVEVAKGQVSAIVGNGLNPATGAPTGGIPSDAFDPTDTHYLQVEVEGQKPYDNLEIVAQPYSLWANTALGLAEGALTGEMVGEKAIEKKHLSDELMSDLKAEFEDMMSKNSLSQTGFKEFKNTVQGVSGAGQVGVVNNLIYSGSQTVQGVLSDLDLAIKKRQEEVDFSKRDYQTKVDAETNARVVADNAEMQGRVGADAILQQNVSDHAALTTAHGSSGTVVGNTTFTAHTDATSAHGASGNIVGTSGEQTLSNKTLSAPKIAGTLEVTADHGAIKLGNVTRTKWSGYQYVYVASHSQNATNCDGDGSCAHTTQGEWNYLTVVARCNLGDTLIGCSGYYGCLAYGEWTCQLMGASPGGNACFSKAGFANCCNDNTLTSYAICAKPF